MSNSFFRSQPENNLGRYINLLKKVGSLSNLFSDSDTPYLYYRVAENIFCRSFEADNHSRSDTTADAGKDGLGIGIKTFINGSGNSFQKIAEFNRNRHEYIPFYNDPEKLVEKVSALRNKRIDFAMSAHGLNNFIYHCVARDKGKFLIFEEMMPSIDIRKIKVSGVKKNNIYFTDGIGEYNFNLSKSTLLKRFITADPLVLDVRILEDPFVFLEELTGEISGGQLSKKIYLPLYSEKDGRKVVREKSGLNQWNASGRKRNEREVYIRVPLWIHRVYPGFFPPKDQVFNLKLPDGKIILMKICQQDGKALMSNPNKALGEWLIDGVLKIKPGNIVTYDILEDVGVDTVEIRKKGENDFEIDFKSLGTFEKFEQKNRK